MSIAKEIAKNVLIQIPVVSELAKKRHWTGMSSDPKKMSLVYERYFENDPPLGMRILELGPGQTCGVMQRALAEGAESVTVVDTEQYIDTNECRDMGIDYRTYDGRRLPFSSGSFDVVCSHTVLEHVRYPDITVEEISRVLAPGGRSVHFIDLRDHYYFGEDNEDVFHCMQYSSKVWNAMTWNRSAYVNRLRYSNWVNLFEQFGIRTISATRSESDCVKGCYESGSIGYLANFDIVDATTTLMLHNGQKAGKKRGQVQLLTTGARSATSDQSPSAKPSSAGSSPGCKPARIVAAASGCP